MTNIQYADIKNGSLVGPLRVAFIIGTRPEIIKMHPIIRECQTRRLDFVIIHTGQHYSPNLSQTFLEQLGYPPVTYNLRIGSGTHGEETGRAIIGIEKVLREECPDVVLVEGDTNTVLAGGIAAVKLRIDVGHVEAGLRSFDRSMPEEINRIITDHASTDLFAPTDIAKSNLVSEGLDEARVYVTGNTIVDSLYEYLKSHKPRTKHKRLDEGYFLVTVHRQENVDNETRFARIIQGLTALQKHFRIPIVYPIHPRAMKQVSRLGLATQGLKMMEPVDYFGFVELERGARLIITDSGGVQEEACILRVPCVTVRESTERPETLMVKSNILAKANPRDMVAKASIMLRKRNSWPNPFGDGRAAKKIVDILQKNY